VTRFPWARAMELGLGHLRLSSAAFWAMTLPELAAALGGAGLHEARAAPSRQTLDALHKKFPD
tara:strand:- start:13053 stop:13241 length:189 start_codon:yes stop_codon:yes gene_type:complete